MNDPLTIYLHDHLAGSNFAVELLESWRAPAAPASAPAFAEELLTEVKADQDELRTIIERVGGEAHTLKEVVGWIAEKASRFKLHNETFPLLGALEGLEMLALGITGKRALWDSLAVLVPHDPRLRDFDFERLALRARQQHARVEARRIELSRQVFLPQ